jgi:fucose 4-O-acetylase-like acetyltransferase
MAERISYIDVAKGIAMLLVVMINVDVPCPIPGLYAAKVPLFFILSGFFLNPDSSEFLVKKLRTLLVPFFLFYILSYAIYYLLLFLYPNISALTHAKGILDIFTQKEYFNGPLWFLLCLFEADLLFWSISHLFKNLIIKILLILLMGFCGFILGRTGTDIPCNFDTALTAMPFLGLGYYFRKYNIMPFFDRLCRSYPILSYPILSYPIQKTVAKLMFYKHENL